MTRSGNPATASPVPAGGCAATPHRSSGSPTSSPALYVAVPGGLLTGRANLRRDEVAIGILHLAARIDIVVVALADVHLAVEEEVNVIGRQTGFKRRGQLLTRRRGGDQARRNDDHQVGFLLLVRRAAEQRAKHRNRPDPGHLRDVLSVACL